MGFKPPSPPFHPCGGKRWRRFLVWRRRKREEKSPISGNFPPLFPASLSFYVGGFHDGKGSSGGRREGWNDGSTYVRTKRGGLIEGQEMEVRGGIPQVFLAVLRFFLLRPVFLWRKFRSGNPFPLKYFLVFWHLWIFCLFSRSRRPLFELDWHAREHFCVRKCTPQMTYVRTTRWVCHCLAQK